MKNLFINKNRLISQLTNCLIIFLLLSFTDNTYTYKTSIKNKFDYFTTDPQGAVYLIKKDVLEKYNSDGKLIKTYSNKNLGNISSVDASNPLRVILFYKDFQQIVFLDNTLSQNGSPLLLQNIGVEQASLACSSNNNGLWIFDSNNFELKRFDGNLQKTASTGNIARMQNISLSVNYIIENNNMIFLNDLETGILTFDIFGTYRNTIPLKGLSSFQVNEDFITYFSDKKLKVYNRKAMEETNYPTPDSTALNTRIEKNLIYIQKENSLNIFTSGK